MRLPDLAVPALAFVLLLAPHSYMAGVPAEQQGSRADPTLSSLMTRARGALDRCDWDEVVASATRVRLRVPAGSDADLEATSLLVRALYERGELEEIVGLARSATAMRYDRERGGPLGLRATLGGVPPIVCDWAALTAIHAARTLQARGEHEGALYFLREVLDDARAGRHARGNELIAIAGLDAAGSLLATGRIGEARKALESLRDNFAGSLECVVATALLQQGSAGLAGYRGRYEGDPRLMERGRVLREALPRARERLSEALDLDPEALERVAVGIADSPVSSGHSAAITLGDPRRPDIPPVVIVFSQFLVQGLFDVETLLVHELAHAYLIGELGITYELLPAWAVEGFSQAVSGEWPLVANALLGRALLEDPDGFVSVGPFVLEPPDLVGNPCGGAFDPIAGLALWALEDAQGLARVRGFLAELRRGAAPSEAYAGLTAAPVESQVEWAQAWLGGRLEELRQPLLPAIAGMLRAREQGDEVLLSTAESILSSHPGGILRGFALWERALALERLGRHELALSDFEDLMSVPHEHPTHQEGARMGRIRCLLALGEPDRARQELEHLRKDAILPPVAAWVEELLVELAPSGSER